MDRINRIARAQRRDIVRFADMELNVVYVVDGLRTFETKYGQKVDVDLEGNRFAYLPKRLCGNLLADDCADLIEL